MPEYWYDYRKAKEQDRLNAESGKGITFNAEIVADRKPYFMTYVYPKLKSDLRNFVQNNVSKMQKKYFELNFKVIEDMRTYDNKTPDMEEFLECYDRGRKTGDNHCTVNRLCWLFEKEFSSERRNKRRSSKFDYSILKSDAYYSKNDYQEIELLYSEYKNKIVNLKKDVKKGKKLKKDVEANEYDYLVEFKRAAELICPDEKALCNLLLDMCYKDDHGKIFAWCISGCTIISNLLENNDCQISFPVLGGDEFEYCGEHFKMEVVNVAEEEFGSDYLE